MPTAPLIGKVATPEFNILGLLMGGPKYMSEYMGAKDTAQQAQNQMGLNAQYAQDLIKRPDFQGAFQPRDQPYVNLWAAMQGGTPQVGALGNSLMESGIQQGLGRDASLLQQKLTQENAKFGQGIEQENAKFNQGITQENTQFSADVQLQTAQKQAQAEAGIQADRMQKLADPQTPQLVKDVLAKQLGVAIPEGTSIVVDPTGNGIAYQPHFGGQAYDAQVKQTQAMMDEIQPIQSLQNQVNSLLDMAQNGTGSQGAWESTKAMFTTDFGKAKGLGSQDQGMLDQMNKIIPDRWDNVNVKGQTNIVAEKLKQTQRLLQGMLQQKQQKWGEQSKAIANASVVARPPPPAESPLTVTRDATKTVTPMSPDASQRPSATVGDVVSGAAKTIWDTAKTPAKPLRRGR